MQELRRSHIQGAVNNAGRLGTGFVEGHARIGQRDGEQNLRG